MYKILVNSQMKMTNIEFTCYVKSNMRKISSKYIIEKCTYSKNDLQRLDGAIIKYK